MTDGIAGFTAPVDQRFAPSSPAWLSHRWGRPRISRVWARIALGHRSLSTDEAAALRKPRGRRFTVLVERPSTTIRGRRVSPAAQARDKPLVTDERAFRAPSAIAVALAAGLMVVLGTMLLGRLAGVVAGMALAANAGVVEASREARPYAARDARRSSPPRSSSSSRSSAAAAGAGSPMRVAAAALPLTHPLAASVLAAHGAALIALRDRPDLRRAGVGAPRRDGRRRALLAWMAADRYGAPDGAGALDLEHLGRGLARAGGWNPILLAAAIAGLVVLLGGRGREARSLARRARRCARSQRPSAPRSWRRSRFRSSRVRSSSALPALRSRPVRPFRYLSPTRGLAWAGRGVAPRRVGRDGCGAG